MSYNGWSNFETWKFNLEVLDGWQREDLFDTLGYSEGDEFPELYDLDKRLSNYFDEFLEEMEASDFVRDWARVAWEAVDMFEIAEHLLLDAKDMEYFSKEEED
jgi:hypothetical protein